MIGEVLRCVRIANDMSIREASVNSGVSASYISELEKRKRGKPSIEILNKICDVYDMRVSEFLEFDGFHDSLIGKKDKLEIYKLLLLEILKSYEEKSNVGKLQK